MSADTASSVGWFRDLAPSERAQAPRGAVTPEPTLQRTRELVGAGSVDWAVTEAYRFSLHLLQEVPEMGGTGHRVIRLGAEVALLQVLRLLADDPTAYTMPEEQQLVVRDCARRRVPIDRLLAAIRRSQAWLTQTLMNECARLVPAQEQAHELQRISALALTVYDELTERAGKEYAVESERWFGSDIAARDELVQAVLRGDESDLPRAAETLRYPLADHYHLGVVVWHDFSREPARAAEFAERWLAEANAQHTLILPQSPSVVWAWGTAQSTGRSTGLPPLPSTATSAHGLRIRHGGWHPGVEGFRRSHHEAQSVERVANLCPPVDQAVLGYHRVSLLALLLQNPEEAARFTTAELGPLAEDSIRAQELRTTVQQYLELHSPKAVAARLYLARGTVTYRLKQAEQILGRSMTERRLELWTAIMLAVSFPSTTLLADGHSPAAAKIGAWSQ